MTTDQIWRLLEKVKDPELPVVSVIEMGMIRSIGFEDKRVIITMTPTFAGCPALGLIKSDIQTQLMNGGASEVEIKIVLSPPWNTDWVTAEGRQKLTAFGISPPPRHNDSIETMLAEPVGCPYCDSRDTSLKNNFGATLCRALHFCHHCQQPFERFKPL